jgi:hypothetical protein
MVCIRVPSWFAPNNRSPSRRSASERPGAGFLRALSSLERLEDRITPAPVPTVVLPPPTTALIGDTVPLSVTFSNTGNAIGYGPFDDVELPTVGNPATASNNGLSFVSASATYLGLPVQTEVLTFDASGHVVHPYLLTSSGQPAVISGTPGDQLVVFTLPLGSFTPGQPPAADGRRLPSPVSCFIRPASPEDYSDVLLLHFLAASHAGLAVR